MPQPSTLDQQDVGPYTLHHHTNAERSTPIPGTKRYAELPGNEATKARGWTLKNQGSDPSHTLYQFNGFIRSTPPQNRQLIVLISKEKQQVDDLVGELTV